MSWLGRLFRQRLMERELHSELRFHIERQVKDNINAGMDEAEARRQAALAFGGMEQVKEECREARGTMHVETLRQDVFYAIRTLRKNPVFSVTAMLTLALGIGGSAAMFSVVRAVLLNPLPYAAPDRLVTLAAANAATLNARNVSFGEAREWAARNRTLEGIVLYRDWQPTVAGETPRPLIGRRVSHNFLTTLRVRPFLGRDFTADEDHPDRWRVLILSFEFWQSEFGGDPGVIGRALQLSERPYKIIGVLPQGFNAEGLAIRAPEIWAPLGYGVNDSFACRSCWHLRAIARLQDGVSLQQARQELNIVAGDVARTYPDEIPKDQRVQMLPLRETMVGSVSSAIWLLFAATGVVLLIACANVTNLLLARSAARSREIALRLALGAGRFRIVRQLVTESVVMCGAAGITGLAFALACIRGLLWLEPAGVPRLQNTGLDLTVFAWAMALSVITGVMIGLTPALYASRSDGEENARIHGSLRQSRFRTLVVITEVALAALLTVSTGLLVRSLLLVIAVNPGFAVEDLHAFSVSLVGIRYAEEEPVIAFQRTMIERVRALPGVEKAAIVSTLPIGGSYDRRGFHVRDRAIPPADAPDVDGYYVSAEYFSTMKIPIVRGRGFESADEGPDAAPVALISETTARELFPGEDPIGRRAIQLGGRNDKGRWATIVGIAGDVRQYGLDSALTPQAYLLYTQEPFSFAQLIVKSSVASGALARTVVQEVRALDKTLPVRSTMMQDVVASSLTQRQFAVWLLGGFGALSVLLAVVGIYGVVAYSVTQRTREFGVRMALGARQAQIFKDVVRQGIMMSGIGLAGGLIAAVAVTRSLKAWLFGVTPTDALTFALAAFLMMLVAVLASIAPARRAIRIDPSAALRWD